MDNIMRLLKQLLYADVIKTENLPLSQYYAFSYEFNQIIRAILTSQKIKKFKKINRNPVVGGKYWLHKQ